MITIYSTIHEYLLYWSSKTSYTDKMRKFRDKYILNYLSPCLGEIELSQYKESHVIQLRNYMHNESGLAESTSFLALRVFKQAMDYAKTQMLITDSFCSNLYIPRCSEDPIQIYTPEELSAIFAAIQYEVLFNYYKLIYYTGITGSEACGIRLSDIDIPNRILHIRQRVLGRTRSECCIVPIEDYTKKRDIYLSDGALCAIQDEIKQSEKKRSKYKKDIKTDFLLFSTNQCKPFFTNHTDIWRTRYVVEAITGISFFSTDSLRYTAADIALNSGVSEKDIQDFLGFTELSYVYKLKDRFVRRKNNGYNCRWRDNQILTQNTN